MTRELSKGEWIAGIASVALLATVATLGIRKAAAQRKKIDTHSGGHSPFIPGQNPIKLTDALSTTRTFRM